MTLNHAHMRTHIHITLFPALLSHTACGLVQVYMQTLKSLSNYLLRSYTVNQTRSLSAPYSYTDWTDSHISGTAGVQPVVNPSHTYVRTYVHSGSSLTQYTYSRGLCVLRTNVRRLLVCGCQFTHTVLCVCVLHSQEGHWANVDSWSCPGELLFTH